MQAPLEPLPWDDVRLFLTLYRARTMGEAARALGVDPSTVSRRLVALEERLDTILFDRGRNGLHATEAAHDLAPSAELAEHGVRQFSDTAVGLERDVEGVVRLTCPTDVADVIVLPALGPLLAAYPRLRATLLPGEAIVDMGRREADLALRVVRPTRGDLVVKRLMTVRWRPATSPALAEALGAPTADALARAPWIGWGQRMASSPIVAWLEAHTAGDPVLRTDNQGTHISAALAGMGLSLLPEPSIAHFGLAAVPLPVDHPGAATLPTLDLWMVAPRSVRNVPRVRATWEALEAYAETLPGASPGAP